MVEQHSALRKLPRHQVVIDAITRVHRVNELFQKVKLLHLLGVLLLAAFLLAEYTNYRMEQVVDELCDLTSPHPMPVTTPLTNQERIARICNDRSADPEDTDDDE